jgi:hypothetical protein
MPEDMLREALNAVGAAIESVTQKQREAVGTR